MKIDVDAPAKKPSIWKILTTKRMLIALLMGFLFGAAIAADLENSSSLDDGSSSRS